jgi:transmembrane sensor
MDESNFDRLLERYVTGQVSPEEKKKIEAWFEVRKNRGEEGVQLTDAEEGLLFQKITANIENEDEIRSFRPESAKRGKTRLIVGIAATFTILLTVISVLFLYAPLRNSSLSNNTERLILNDGTIIWLRGTSTFDYYEGQDGSRHGVLNGEALFEIAKDPLHPFTIKHNSYTITVLGTSFNLRAVHDNLELKVLTGKVRLTTSYDSTGVIVEHLEGVKLSANDELRKSKFEQQDISTLVQFTEYDMNFKEAEMRAVAERLSKKFGVEFKFENPKIGDCGVTADFTDRSLESTTAMLADVLNAKFKREGRTILVEGLGCD